MARRASGSVPHLWLVILVWGGAATFLTGLFCAASFASPSRPRGIVGMAYFAMMSPRFPCARALRVFEGAEHPATAVLWGSFGTDETCVKEFVAQAGEREHIIEIHFDNGPARRAGRQGPGDFMRGWSVRHLNTALERHDKRVVAAAEDRAARMADFAQRLGSSTTEWLLSLTLEDDYTDEAANALAKIFDGIWAHPLVRNPNHNRFPVVRGHRSPWIYREYHSLVLRPAGGPRDIFNLDGYEFRGNRRRTPARNRRVGAATSTCVSLFPVGRRIPRNLRRGLCLPSEASFSDY